MPVFQGVRVTPDGIFGITNNPDGTSTLYQKEPNNNNFNPVKNQSSPDTGGGTTVTQGGGFSTRMYDKEGNEYDPKTGQRINKESPFDKGPETINDKPKTELQKAIADYQANRQKQLNDFLKINGDIFQRTIQLSNQFHQNSAQLIQMVEQAAQTQNTIERMK